MEEKQHSKIQKIYKIVMLILLTSFATFMITSLSLYTYYTDNYVVLGKNSEADKGILNLVKEIKKVRQVMDEYYLWNDDIDEEKLYESAVTGYVSGLGDKYTKYISKDNMEEFTEDISGSFVGIGIYMTNIKDKGIVIYASIPESPAEKAGLKSGDIIVSVDGEKCGYDDFDNISEKLKGEEGSTVKIVVNRDGKEKEFDIVREKVTANPITTELLKNNVGYIVLPSFDEETAEHFKDKAEKLIQDGAKSLIIDLRNNSGGIVEESIKIADYFLDKDLKIMSTNDKDGKKEVAISNDNPIFNCPVVILSNQNTASASEILIGALKDNKRAKIIGDKSYGKGIIQTVISLPDGSGMKVTTTQYYTPNGTAIHGVGIEPDIKVELPDTVTSLYSVDRDKDTQLEKAFEELKK